MRKSKKAYKNQIDFLNKQIKKFNVVIDEYKLEMAIVSDFLKANEEIHKKFKEFKSGWLDDIRNEDKVYKVSSQLEGYIELCDDMDKIIEVCKKFISEDSEVEKAWKKFAKEKGYVV